MFLSLTNILSSVEIYVFFGEKFNGHVVDRFNFLFEYDSSEKRLDAFVALHESMLCDEKRDAALTDALRIFWYHVIAHDLDVAPVRLQQKIAYEVCLGIERDAMMHQRMVVEEFLQDDIVFFALVVE